MKKAVKILFALLLIMSTFTLVSVGYFSVILDDNYCIVNGETLKFQNDYIKCSEQYSDNSLSVQNNNSNTVNQDFYQISLFGIFPVKQVSVTKTQKSEVAVLGTPFGIRIFSEGVLVVGLSDVDTHNGNVNPAKNAGIKVGDIILEVNGICVDSNTDVQTIIVESLGNEIKMLIKRDDKKFTVTIKPEKSVLENIYKCGLWIRDSSAGIGTLTFYSPDLCMAAGLGHGVCDADTQEIIPLESGQFVEAEIVGIKKSSKETTGELQGVFSGGQIADMINNCETGVYGNNCQDIVSDSVMEIALKQDIKLGKAQVITTIDENGPKVYECVIEKIYHNDNSKIKNMIIKITDKELIEKTGGIVQGMSGSPIIQNGKLIGAVTHVLIDDPTKGYGIFAENMLETAQSVSEQQLKEVS